MPVSKIGKSRRMAVTSSGVPAGSPDPVGCSYVEVDIISLHLDGIDRHRLDRRQRVGVAGAQVEARAVLRALDLESPELAHAEREVLVRADVVDGVPVAVLGVHQA